MDVCGGDCRLSDQHRGLREPNLALGLAHVSFSSNQLPHHSYISLHVFFSSGVDAQTLNFGKLVAGHLRSVSRRLER